MPTYEKDDMAPTLGLPKISNPIRPSPAGDGASFAERAETEESLEKAIADDGYAVVCSMIEVNGCELFASFSVGLSRLDLPELITLSLSSEVASQMIHAGAAKIVLNDLSLGERVGGVIQGLDVFFQKVDLCKWSEVASTVSELAAVPSIELVQMIWPDKSGFFPWQDGFDQTLALWQPLMQEGS